MTQSATSCLAIGVIGAAAVAPVEQVAGDVGRIEEPGVLILELVQAAAAAAVAQRFPFAAVERGQGLFPESGAVGVVHDKPAMVCYGAPIKRGVKEDMS